MATYVGDKKIKINIDGVLYKLNLSSELIVPTIAGLLSSDGYILKDSNGLFLIAKDGE